MSNIFYSEVDRNLQLEVNARGRAGFYDRSEKALNFMLGKMANVECIAYDGKDSTTRVVGTLGGEQMRTGRFLPSGKDGYLTDPVVDQYSIDYFTERDITMDPDNKDIVVGNAYVRSHRFTDTSKRTAPYLTAVDITLGDHSHGVLNKANFAITIPNTQRDLDDIEQVWFRPGRYISITIEYPDSVLASKTLTDGMLTRKSLPIWERVQQKFPKFKKDTQDKYPKMNKFSYEGLVTNFDMTFNPDGSVSATINSIGTSNTYTDITMIMDRGTTQQNVKSQVSPSDIKTNPVPEYFAALHDYIKKISEQFQADNGLQQDQTFIAPFSQIPNSTDQFILYGEPYYNSISTSLPRGPKTAETNQTRYITLGAMIEFINKYILVKMEGSVANPLIIHDDTDCFSNYYDSIVSCDPEQILLLPKNVLQNSFLQTDVTPDCNTYGNLVYYSNVYTKTEWPGVYAKGGVTGKIYPSRIFINIETIQGILQRNPTITVNNFLASISSLVENATAGAIKLNLVSHPEEPKLLLWSDIKYIRSNAYDSTASVVPFSIPMFSNHPNGSAVLDFTFTAKIPDSVKSLTYSLNNGSQLSEQELAPHMNFMYNAQNKEQLEKLVQRYRDRHDEIVSELARAKTQYGQSPGVPEHRTALYKALAEYIKYPVSDFRQAQQMTGPIWPFEATVTIDGIHGFKYGDVVQFDALPLRYRRNTVFSIFGVTHTVNETGQWTTALRCVMRSNID